MRIYSIFLMFLLAAPFMYKSYVVGHYFYFLDYYASELCENKQEPEKKCNGSCQLRKELSNAQENTNPDKQQKSLPKIEVSSFIVPHNLNVDPFNIPLSRAINFSGRNDAPLEGFLTRYAKPPIS